jgi:predicted RNA-binding protein with PUA-like domain
MARKYWLLKSEPGSYSWEQLVADGSTTWDGVRNYQSRNNLGEMKPGDLALFYHSNEGKDVVGVARISREAHPDPTSADARWLAVEVEPVRPLAKPVSLQQIKADPTLREIGLVRQGRLSVVALRAAEFQRILKLGETRLARS